MRVFCTGVSGSGRDDYLERAVEFAKKYDSDISYHSIAKYLIEFDKKSGNSHNMDYILNLRESQKANLVSGAYELLYKGIENAKNALISSHAGFYWNEHFVSSLNDRHIKKINPDIFVTIIESISTIQQRLNKRTQWSEQNLDLKILQFWQNVEVVMTQQWATFYDKPHFIIASSESPSYLVGLMFTNMKRVYVSYPMTHAKDAETKKEIIKFIDKLKDYFLVNDPGTIEVNSDFETGGQTIHRDLEWYINNNAELVIAYYPVAVPGVGVPVEMREASIATKKVWFIAPEELFQGQFEKVLVHKRFNSTEGFFSFCDEYLKENQIKKWSELNKDS